MSVAKVTEITAESPESFEAAIRAGIERAASTIDNMRSAWVNEQNILIRDGKVSGYRVNMRITFVLND